MLEVYHYPLCPFSRKLRIVLKEKSVPFELFLEQFWLRRNEYMRMNPSGETPSVMHPELKQAIYGNHSLFEFLEETYKETNLLGTSPTEKLKTRQICEWFDVKFFNEVTRYIFNEKIVKTVARSGEPNSKAIQAAKRNIISHLDYISFLCRDSRYLTGDRPMLSDFAAAAQLSVLDFVGDVPWNQNQKAKEWYALIKSRPSFKPLLMDKIPNFYPPTHYANPDF
jgi:glutathione S-transferase